MEIDTFQTANCHGADFVVTAGIATCPYDDMLWCYQQRQNWRYRNSQFSVYIGKARSLYWNQMCVKQYLNLRLSIVVSALTNDSLSSNYATNKISQKPSHLSDVVACCLISSESTLIWILPLASNGHLQQPTCKKKEKQYQIKIRKKKQNEKEVDKKHQEDPIGETNVVVWFRYINIEMLSHRLRYRRQWSLS